MKIQIPGILLFAAIATGCAHTVVVREPPRHNLAQYGTLGVIDFSSNANADISRYATREFEARVQSNQEGVRFKDLGPQEDLLQTVGADQLDDQALQKIGAKYGVDAVVTGAIDFSQPQTTIHLSDASSGSGSAQAVLQGNIFTKLIDVKTGAGVWSRSGWARRQIADVRVAKSKGVNVDIQRDNDPHYDMVPDLVSLVTEDFRPSFVRQKAK